MSAILVGCDPEVFVKQGGFFRSAWGLIQGDKQNPHKVRNGAVQVDGMALEFNIEPASTEDEFCFNVQDVFDQMKKMVPAYQVVIVPVAHFDREYMSVQPLKSLELGCDPDFNSWSGMENIKPNAEKPMRTASGHIHVGWTEGQDSGDPAHQYRCQAVGKNMDFFVGLGSLFYDDDKERREMYGKAGCIRFKPYGVEYRTLSNAWLGSEKLMRWVYRNTIKCVEETMQGNFLFDKYGDIQDIINLSNKKEAKKILVAEDLEIPHV